MNRKQLKTVVGIAALLLFIAPVAAGEQLLKPTAHTDSEGITNNPAQAYDFLTYDESTSSSTTDSNSDPSITFSSWNTTGKKSYTSLSLDVTVSSSGFSNDAWGLYVDTGTGTTCSSADTTIKSSAATNTALTNYTVSLPASQDLSLLEVCLSGTKNQGPDGGTVAIYDIRTEGQFDANPPDWRSQQQNQSIIKQGEPVELSSQGFDSVQLDYGILSTNESGSWQNKSVYGSPVQLSTSGTWTWSNFTWQNSSFSSGEVSWKVWYNDTSGNYNSTDVKSFEVDSDLPGLNILNPESILYDSSTIDLNVTADETISAWKYNLDGGSNTTFTPNITLSGLAEGAHAVEAWAQDEAGNWNSTSRSFEVDTVSPSFSSRKETPGSPVVYRQRQYQFNITVNDANLDAVKFEFAGTNYTPQSASNEYYVELENLSAGSYSYRWYANDTAGNENATQSFPYQIDKAAANTSLFLNGTAADSQYAYNSTANLSVDLNVSQTVELWENFSGSLQKRSSGSPLLESLLKLDFNLGIYTIKGVFFGNENYTAENETRYLEIVDNTSPIEKDGFDNSGSRVYKGESIGLKSYWEDNYDLDSGRLSVNSSGQFKNSSSRLFSSGWANFSYSVPVDSFPGTLGWRVWANDTSSNNALGTTRTQAIWGYSDSLIELNSTAIQLGESVKTSCRVTDSNSSSPVSGYPVQVYNGTVKISEGSTGNQGWYNYTFTPSSSQDNVPVECRIFEEKSLKYTGVSNSSKELTVNSGAPPSLVDSFYGINSSQNVIGDTVSVYARWNESLNYSYVEFDSLKKGEYSKIYKKAPFTNNYTNFTLETNKTWFKGTHTVKIYANDSEGNLNNTLEYLEYNVTGYTSVNASFPAENKTRGTVKLGAEVYDSNTSEAVDSYKVSFWFNGTLLGTNQTNSTGTAVYYWDTSSLDVGEKKFKVNITGSDYYRPSDSSDNQSFNLTGVLDPRISSPKGIVHRGVSESLEADVYTGQGDLVAPDTAKWYNSTGSLLLNGEDGSWTVPENYTLGPETVYFNVTKSFYADNFSTTDVTVYGYARIEAAKLDDSKIKQGESTAYSCRIGAQQNSDFIENYPVKFLNGTQYIGETLTNSTGWASITFTDNTAGFEDYECQIRDNSTLYYNDSVPKEYSRTLETVDIYKPNYTIDSPQQSSLMKKNNLWFNSTWEDNYNLSKVVYGFNDTGSFSNVTLDVSGEVDSADYAFQNTSFEGNLGYRIYGNDTYGNQNYTSGTVTIQGGADIHQIDLNTSRLAPGKTVGATCDVRDNLTGSGIEGYPVEFYNGTQLHSSGQTGSAGNITFAYTQDFEGDVNLECRISDQSSMFYLADTASKSKTVSFEYGETTGNTSAISVTAGILKGDKTRLEKEDSNLVSWTNLTNISTSRVKRIIINGSAEIPPSTIQKASFSWTLKRFVENRPYQLYSPGTTGTMSLSNGDINATWFQDTEYLQLTEGKSGNKQVLGRKGFYLYLPENESEVVPSKLEIRLEVQGQNVDTGEEISADVYNPSTGGYEACGASGTTTYVNVSCQFTDQTTLSQIINGDELRIEFTDTSSTSGEAQSSWRIDDTVVKSYYNNPATGNTFEYRLGFRNWSSGSLKSLDRAGISGNTATYFANISSNNSFNDRGEFSGYLTFYTNNTPATPAYREHGFLIDRFKSNLSYQVSRVKDYQVSIKNSTGDIVSGINFTVMKDGKVIDEFSASSGESFADKLDSDKNYTVKQSIPYGGKRFNITFRDLRLSKSVSPETRFVNYSALNSDLRVSNVSNIYAVDTSSFDFRKATLRVPKIKGSPDSILHCTSYDFDTDSCGSWEVNDTSAYPHVETADYLEFNVTGFDAFGTGNGEPLPNVTSVKIYDVTGLLQSQKQTGGELVAEGLNKTFNINQTDSTRTYRFQFRIRNDGTKDWTLEGADQLYHNGLNQTWSVGKTWYNLSGSEYVGGTFSGGKVSWDTALGGMLQKKDGSDVMWAKYLVNITQKESKLYNERFVVNDTSNNAGSQDYHELNITKYGYLDVELLEPPNQTTLQQNQTFTANASVTCREGICEDVNLSVRYNQSSNADTLIPVGSGKPFYTLSTNTGVCGVNLGKDDICYRSWDVNATGDLKSKHLLDANATSSLSTVKDNDSADNEVTINQAVLIDVKWDKLDFGVLDPGAENKSATGNDNLLYNITVSENSLKVDNLWIKMDDMDPYSGSYVIPAENVSYSTQNDISTETQMKNSYQHLASDISSGTNLTTYYWLDVPEGIKSTEYNSTIYFKANETQ